MANRPTKTIETSLILAYAIIAACLFVAVDVFLKVPYLGAGGVVVDFDAFYIAGQMLWDGQVHQAYDPQIVLARQSALAGEEIFMPWTYPPQFDLVAMLFPLASRGVAYLLFTVTTLIVYLAVLRRIAGPFLAAVLVALLPTLLITIRTGQNGFLLGSLVGLFLLLWTGRHPVAGLPLGLMVIKPHLAVGLGVLALFSRQWAAIAVAGAVVIATSALATMILGVAVWAEFLSAARYASGFLEEGVYPLFRMTSLYAALFTAGIPPSIAMPAQIALALLACGSIALATRLNWEPRNVAGLTVLATLLISPYNYDYDLPILGIGLAFLAPAIMAHTRPAERLVLLALTWLASGWGLATILVADHAPWVKDLMHQPAAIASLGALGLLGLTIAIWSVLLFRAQGARQPAAA